VCVSCGEIRSGASTRVLVGGTGAAARTGSGVMCRLYSTSHKPVSPVLPISATRCFCSGKVLAAFRQLLSVTPSGNRKSFWLSDGLSLGQVGNERARAVGVSSVIQ
jgi:hypothetical protein